MDSRQSKRRKGSKGPRKPSQSRASIEEVDDPTQSAPVERSHRSKKLNRNQEAHPPVASRSPEAECSRTASSSRSPTEAAVKKRSNGKDQATPLRKTSKKRKASIEAATTSSTQLSLADETEVDRAVSLQADNTDLLLQSASQARINTLEQENARLLKELASKDGALHKQRQTISYIYGQCTCTVCMELAWRPHVLSPCGHVFCARCLVAWFTKPTSLEGPVAPDDPNRIQLERTRNLNRVKACPQCREKVTTAPVEVWLVKSMVDHIDQSMREGQGNDEHLVQGNEPLAGLSAPELKEAKGGNLPASPAIWKDIFKPPGDVVVPIFDEEDRVFRCTMCASEVVNGQCTNPACLTPYEMHFPDGTDSMDSDDDYSFDSEELDDEDLAFIDDDGMDGFPIDDGPIVIDDNSDDDDDGHHHSDHGDFDSVIFASGSEQGAIVISSESSDDEDYDDQDSVHEVQQEDEEEDLQEEVRSDDEDGLQEADEEEALQYDEDEVQDVDDEDDLEQYDDEDEDDVQLVDEDHEDQGSELSASEAGASDSDY